MATDKTLPRCEGVIPEEVRQIGEETVVIKEPVYRTVKVPHETYELQADDTYTCVIKAVEAQELIEPGETEVRPITKTIPEHLCENIATQLSRSMKERKNEHGPAWWEPVPKGDKVYCPDHFIPGKMIHLDGTVTGQPPIHIGG